MIDRQVIGPYDMEQDLGLIGGNIFHGELSVDQLFHMRPAPGYADFRTPIKGLYHGSCATHGGGGVNGIPGWQAFKHGEEGQGRRPRSSVRDGSRAVDPDGRTALERMLEARSVAVVGASVKEGSLGQQMMVELRRGGFDGAIYPVNPGYEEVAGPSVLPVDRRGAASPWTWRSSASRTIASSRRCATRSRPARGRAVTFSRCYEDEPPEPGVPPLAERARRDRARRRDGDVRRQRDGVPEPRGAGCARPGSPTPDEIRARVRWRSSSHSGSAFAALAFNDRGSGSTCWSRAGRRS